MPSEVRVISLTPSKTLATKERQRHSNDQLTASSHAAMRVSLHCPDPKTCEAGLHQYYTHHKTHSSSDARIQKQSQSDVGDAQTIPTQSSRPPAIHPHCDQQRREHNRMHPQAQSRHLKENSTSRKQMHQDRCIDDFFSITIKIEIVTPEYKHLQKAALE